MLSFKSFIIEEEQEAEGKKLKHLTHLEDKSFHEGHQGVSEADKTLRGVEKQIEGKDRKSVV